MAGHAPVLLACVFLMGVHSTLFGPVKFAYLPQVLTSASSPAATAWWRWAPSSPSCWAMWPAACWWPCRGRPRRRRPWPACLALARLVAGFIPSAPATDPAWWKLNWNPVSETWRNLQLAHGNIVVFRSLLGISWMWFFGAVFC